MSACLTRTVARALLLLVVASSVAATSFDDSLQQQRFDAVVEQLNNDADPNTVIPMVYDYMGFYVWIGYSDPAKADPDADINRVFGSTYAGYFSRMADRFNERLGQCDPTVVPEVLEYIDFHTVGYTDATILSDRQKIEKSVFWSGYLEWQVNDLLREKIDDDQPGEPTISYTQALDHLRQGSDKQKSKAAVSLGKERPAGALTSAYLARLLSDPSSLVRYWAVRMLSRSDTAESTVLGPLRDALDDHSWPVRHAAAQLLSRLRDRQSKIQADAILASARVKSQPWPSKARRSSKQSN